MTIRPAGLRAIAFLIAIAGIAPFATAEEFVPPRGIQLLRALRQRAARNRPAGFQRVTPRDVAPRTQPREPATLNRVDSGRRLVAPATSVRSIQPQPAKKQPKPKLPQTKPPTVYDKPFKLRSLDEIVPSDDYIPAEITERSKQKPKEDTAFWKKQTMPARRHEAVQFAWEASNLNHNPLYFEDPQLERYGHAFPDCVQPFVSIGRFGAQLLGLPYQTAIDPVHKCVYPLGWYNPGECAPKLIYQVPWNSEAAGVEAGVAVGLFFLIP